MIVAGVHGNELAPQIAALNLIDELFNLNSNNALNGTVYIIPSASPRSTMDNSRYFDGIDLNRSAHFPHSITNIILRKAKELKVSAIGDFHSSAPNSNPGKEGVFCTQKPCDASFYIADYISKKVGSEKIIYPIAGIPFKGALEDEANLGQIPAVTCEVLSAIGYSNEKICKRSHFQMKAFLEYFGIID